mmetsp:Transcript_16632/g.18499  ORF Transcript_16632/g.18499 Transcript_16632/m.18499 type:complete len:251 (-) Transcript_16632:33-785(-)
MDKPCCVGVVRSADKLKGKEEKLGDLPIYYCEPTTETKQKVAVLVAHDIFGYGIPNCKYIVDYLAGKGFYAVMPDFYHNGKAWPAEKALSGDDFGKWFGSITTPAFWENLVNKDATSVVNYIKEKGYDKVACIGFCWGGLCCSSALAASGLFASAVSLHGVGDGVEAVKKAKCPVFYITVAGDAYFNEKTQKDILQAYKDGHGKGGDVKVFGDGMYHGFVVRGDYDKNETLKAKADEAMADTVAFIKKHA